MCLVRLSLMSSQPWIYIKVQQIHVLDDENCFAFRFLISGFNHSFSTMLLAYVRCFYLNVISPSPFPPLSLAFLALAEISFEDSFLENILLVRTDFATFRILILLQRTLPCECPLISNKFSFVSARLSFCLSQCQRTLLSLVGSCEKYEIYSTRPLRHPSCTHKSILFIQQ